MGTTSVEVSSGDRYELREVNEEVIEEANEKIQDENIEIEHTTTTLAPRRSSGQLASDRSSHTRRKNIKKIVETVDEDDENSDKNDCNQSNSLFLLPACSEKVLTKKVDESLACYTSGIKEKLFKLNSEFH